MERRPIADTGIEMSVLGIGCWSYGGGDYWGPQSQEDVNRVVHAALDRGINYFDSAEGYNSGRSEEALGVALKGRRTEAVIGTKVSPSNTQPEVLRQHCDASLQRLQTDCIDVYMVHWPITQHSVEDAFVTLAALRDEGKIRSVSVSNFGVEQFTEVLATGVVPEVNQLCYSLIARAIEVEILPLCQKHGTGILGYMPLQQGLLTGKYQTAEDVPLNRARTRHFRGDRAESRHGGPGAEEETFEAIAGIRQVADELGIAMGQLSLAWAIAKPGITSILAGTRNLDQLDDNIQAASLQLPSEVIARLDALTQPLLGKLGANADYYQGVERGRIR